MKDDEFVMFYKYYYGMNYISLCEEFEKKKKQEKKNEKKI